MSDGRTPAPAPPDLERRLATILCADIAGYSRMMGENEERTVRVFRGHREIFESLVAQHRGRIFNTAGDALLAEFPSAVEAVRCATDIQAALRTRNEHLATEERMQFRIGINLGDVIVQGEDLLGDGVNVAARIQAATEPGGICISGSVHEQILNKLSLDFKLVGELTYKNIAKPIRTYTINEGAAVTMAPRRAPSKTAVAIAAAVVLAAVAGYWGYGQFETQRAERSRIESQLAAQREATGQAQRAAEDAKRESQMQAQKQAAEEAVRRAQDERNRLEQERRRLEAEKRAAEAATKQAEASSRAVPAVPTSNLQYDGNYNGRLCNQIRDKPPNCWPVALVVRNGIAEGSWTGLTRKTATARGAVAADGAVRLSLAAWTPSGAPTEAILLGRFADGAISASGEWRTGGEITGNWRRGPVAAATTATTMSSQGAVRYDGNYSGRLCNHDQGKAPNCWPVALVLRTGIVEGSWLSRLQKTASVRGTVAADGAVKLNLATWTPSDIPTEAMLIGRVADGAISASGKWREGGTVTGDWQRLR